MDRVKKANEVGVEHPCAKMVMKSGKILSTVGYGGPKDKQCGPARRKGKGSRLSKGVTSSGEQTESLGRKKYESQKMSRQH